MDGRIKLKGYRSGNGDCHESKAHNRCEGQKKSQSLLRNIRRKGEGVKRRLKDRKVRRTGNKNHASSLDDTDMK